MASCKQNRSRTFSEFTLPCNILESQHQKSVRHLKDTTPICNKPVATFRLISTEAQDFAGPLTTGSINLVI